MGRVALATAGRIGAHLALAILPSLLAGEMLLRVIWREGVSFSEAGSIGRRFHREAGANHYVGPGRGPEVTGAKPIGTRRILILGDSITWGQGVRDDDSLYTARVARRLASVSPPVEVAAIARMGRETDDHLDMLRRYGAEVDPDVIVYQWFPNDMEVGKKNRPWKDPPWTRAPWHDTLATHSFLYFFLHYEGARFARRNTESFPEFFTRQFSGDTPEWRTFTGVFREWAREARERAPRVVVMLYPIYDGRGSPLAKINEKMRVLCAECGVDVLDLDAGEGLRGRQLDRIAASRFDGHPNAATHAEIADRLIDYLLPIVTAPAVETG
jgi:lysophospholipase L1-like esterase